MNLTQKNVLHKIEIDVNNLIQITENKQIIDNSTNAEQIISNSYKIYLIKPGDDYSDI